MSGTKLTLFGKENIIFILKRRSRTDWSRTKVIYGGFSSGSVEHGGGQPSFPVSLTLKTRKSKLARTALMGQETLKNITRTAFYEVCTLKWLLMCLFTVFISSPYWKSRRPWGRGMLVSLVEMLYPFTMKVKCSNFLFSICC